MTLHVPDEAEAVITIRATISQFKQMRVQIADCEHKFRWPLSEVTQAIDNAVERASREWHAPAKEDEETK